MKADATYLHATLSYKPEKFTIIFDYYNMISLIYIDINSHSIDITFKKVPTSLV